MPRLLAIEVSPRFDTSVSRHLTAKFIAKWHTKNPDGQVVIRDLAKDPLPYVDLPWVGGAFAPAEYQTPEMHAAIAVSDGLIAELRSADHIVIGTPMYNFSIPSALKAWIDHVVRIGQTFTAQYEGLLTGKIATIIMASGGDFSAGSYTEAMNAAIPYLRQILGFIGITDVKVMLAGKTTTIDQGQTTMADYVAEFDDIEALAA
jgi:FMN-dependent NADH-azoreductase